MIPVSEIKTWLGIDSTDSTYDTVLGQLETRAVAFVSRVTGRYFGGTATTSEIIEGTDQKRLWLSEPSTVTATAMAVVYVANPGDSTSTLTATAADGWQVRTEGNEGYLIRKGGNIWFEPYEYTVTYTRGYATSGAATSASIAVPGEIRQLVLDLIAVKWRGRGQEGLRSERIDNYSYTRDDFSDADIDTIPWARSVIDKWRRLNV